MQKGKSNIIWYIVGGIVLIGGGVGTYFFLKKRKEKKEVDELALKEQEAKATNPPTGGSTQSNPKGSQAPPSKPKGSQAPATTYDSSSDGFDKIKSQMLDNNIWGKNIKLDSSSEIKSVYALDVDGLKDAYIAFNKNGEFSISFKFGSTTKGNWAYSNDSFSLTLSDGSYLGQGSNIAKLVKELLKVKYPDKMQYFKFEGVNSVDSILNMSGKPYTDAQDSIL